MNDKQKNQPNIFGLPAKIVVFAIWIVAWLSLSTFIAMVSSVRDLTQRVTALEASAKRAKSGVNAEIGVTIDQQRPTQGS